MSMVLFLYLFHGQATSAQDTVLRVPQLALLKNALGVTCPLRSCEQVFVSPVVHRARASGSRQAVPMLARGRQTSPSV